ncbi:MAG: flagellar hook assembly protein FlgD [Burkholderiaceae bacterium]|nr:flagellar hook assembly protein FlgD [Ideonella sp.]MCC7286255.1 flagellar hook assembly protein FlgD [Burkholderiaceae bacterium]
MTTTAVLGPGGFPAAGAALGGANGTNTEDRFLKLLVAQMRNQDPLNPMDNAQVTSQMAQIQTVSGIDKLNTTVQGLNAQFAQLQALSGAALVGRDVLIEGNRLIADADGSGHGGFELASPADRVRLEVLDASGRVIDASELGAMASGRHSFDWTPPPGVAAASAARFRIAATLGATAVNATAFTRDRVDAVSVGPTGLMLELAHFGPLAYDQVKAFD